MAGKKSKKAKAGTASVVPMDCPAVVEIKSFADQIAAVVLPPGSTAAVKARLLKLSIRVIASADGIQKQLNHSAGSIERTAKKVAKIQERIKKAQEQLTKLQS